MTRKETRGQNDLNSHTLLFPQNEYLSAPQDKVSAAEAASTFHPLVPTSQELGLQVRTTPPFLAPGCTDCAEKLARHRKHCEMVHQDCVSVNADEQLQNRKELLFTRLRNYANTWLRPFLPNLQDFFVTTFKFYLWNKLSHTNKKCLLKYLFVLVFLLKSNSVLCLFARVLFPAMAGMGEDVASWETPTTSIAPREILCFSFICHI